jgi:hypothetical protein
MSCDLYPTIIIALAVSSTFHTAQPPFLGHRIHVLTSDNIFRTQLAYNVVKPPDLTKKRTLSSQQIVSRMFRLVLAPVNRLPTTPHKMPWRLNRWMHKHFPVDDLMIIWISQSQSGLCKSPKMTQLFVGRSDQVSRRRVLKHYARVSSSVNSELYIPAVCRWSIIPYVLRFCESSVLPL